LRTFRIPYLLAHYPVVFEQQFPSDDFHREGLGVCRILIRGFERAMTDASWAKLAELFTFFPMPIGWSHLASLVNYKTWTGQDCFKFVSHCTMISFISLFSVLFFFCFTRRFIQIAPALLRLFFTCVSPSCENVWKDDFLAHFGSAEVIGQLILRATALTQQFHAALFSTNIILSETPQGVPNQHLLVCFLL
jgi:hypothetical protein